MGNFFAETYLFGYVTRCSADLKKNLANAFCYLKVKSWQMIKL